MARRSRSAASDAIGEVPTPHVPMGARLRTTATCARVRTGANAATTSSSRRATRHSDNGTQGELGWTVTRLILASQSPARTKLLSHAGIRHEILVSDVDEDAVQARYGVTDAHDTALLLARAKAEAVASLPEAEGALVLGCDSVFEFDGESHGKPYTAEVARERMLRMSGNRECCTPGTGWWTAGTPTATRRGRSADRRDARGTGATLGAVTSARRSISWR